MTPFLMENPEVFELGDYIFVPNVRAHVLVNDASFDAYAVKPDDTVTKFPVSTGALTEAERQSIADGCLLNYYRGHKLARLFDSDGVPVSWDTWPLYPKTKRLSEGVERFVAFMEREQKK